MEKTHTVYGDPLAWQHVLHVPSSIRAFVSHIKKNGFPFWYKESKPAQLMTEDEANEERERIVYEHFEAYFARNS